MYVCVLLFYCCCVQHVSFRKRKSARTHEKYVREQKVQSHHFDICKILYWLRFLISHHQSVIPRRDVQSKLILSKYLLKFEFSNSKLTPERSNAQFRSLPVARGGTLISAILFRNHFTFVRKRRFVDYFLKACSTRESSMSHQTCHTRWRHHVIKKDEFLSEHSQQEKRSFWIFDFLRFEREREREREREIICLSAEIVDGDEKTHLSQ